MTPDFAVSGWRSLHMLVCNATCSSADGVPIDTFLNLLLLSELRHLTTLPMPSSGQHDRKRASTGRRAHFIERDIATLWLVRFRSGDCEFVTNPVPTPNGICPATVSLGHAIREDMRSRCYANT